MLLLFVCNSKKKYLLFKLSNYFTNFFFIKKNIKNLTHSLLQPSNYGSRSAVTYSLSSKCADQLIFLGKFRNFTWTSLKTRKWIWKNGSCFSISVVYNTKQLVWVNIFIADDNLKILNNHWRTWNLFHRIRPIQSLWLFKKKQLNISK